MPELDGLQISRWIGPKELPQRAYAATIQLRRNQAILVWRFSLLMDHIYKASSAF